MNQTRIQYALIAHREILEAKRRIDLWQDDFMGRLASLDDDEVVEFKKRGGVIGRTYPALRTEEDLSKMPVFS